MELKTMAHAAPICATVSRKTGEISIQWADDQETQIRFGRYMNRLSRIAEAWEDEQARKAFDAQLAAKMNMSEDAFRGAATKNV